MRGVADYTIHMTVAERPVAPPSVRRGHRFTRAEYRQLGETGVFRGKRVELIDGIVWELHVMNPPHAVAVGLLDGQLRRIFREGYWVRTQLPLAVGQYDEPEPDFVVVAGSPRDYLSDHPGRPLLIAEVSDSTLREDREYQGSLYASASYQEYWIVNLVDRCLEVYRNPRPDPPKWFGWGYADVQILRSEESITPLAAPDKPIKVADLLP